MTIKTYLILASLALVTACGVSGSLEKAPPLWGADRAVYEAEQAKKEEARKAAEAARAAKNPPPAIAPAPAPKN
jgi:predicted small lipoprotein YifL